MYPVLHEQEASPGYSILGTHMLSNGEVCSSFQFGILLLQRPRRERSRALPCPALPCPQNPLSIVSKLIDVLSPTLMSITAVHIYLEISG